MPKISNSNKPNQSNQGHTHSYNLRSITKIKTTIMKIKPSRSTKIIKTTIKLFKISKPNQTKPETTNLNTFIKWNEFNKYISCDHDSKITAATKKQYVSPTSLKNYILNATLSDWIKHTGYRIGAAIKDTKLKGKRNQSNKPAASPVQSPNQSPGQAPNQPIITNSKNMLFAEGNNFEKTIYNEFMARYPESISQININNYMPNPETMNQTFDSMRKGHIMIFQAPLYNTHNYTFGISDILIRSDMINEVFGYEVLEPSEATKQATRLARNQKYHYIVIDIKWSTLTMAADNIHILNNNFIPTWKCQLAIYNAALGILQGYTPPKAFIMAKTYKNRLGIRFDNQVYTRLGQIDFMGRDNVFLKKTLDAIRWVRDLRTNGHTWSCDPPTRLELRPNMSNKYDDNKEISRYLASKYDELTMVWNVNVTDRNRLIIDKKIDSWRDKKFTAEVLGKRGHMATIINNMLAVNRGIHELLPHKIKDNSFGWKTKTPNDFYIDFETINNCFCKMANTNNNDDNMNNQSHNIIFMIGVGYEFGGEWNYKYFTLEKYNLANEHLIISQFIEYINNISDCPRFFYWSPAERTLFEAANRRHKLSWSNWIKDIKWIDFCDICKKEPITIKGCFSFGLKEFANAMYTNNMINTQWPKTNIDSGLSAMFEATKYYKFVDQYGILDSEQKGDIMKINECLENDQILHNIIKYNEVDCKVIFEIVDYFRKLPKSTNNKIKKMLSIKKKICKRLPKQKARNRK